MIDWHMVDCFQLDDLMDSPFDCSTLCFNMIIPAAGTCKTWKITTNFLEGVFSVRYYVPCLANRPSTWEMNTYPRVCSRKILNCNRFSYFTWFQFYELLQVKFSQITWNSFVTRQLACDYNINFLDLKWLFALTRFRSQNARWVSLHYFLCSVH